MHIPDGFLSPKLYVPSYVAAVGLWTFGLRRVRHRLDARTVPLLAVTTALAFVLMSVTLPLPGGTSVHATGIAVLAVQFGVWISFLALTATLTLQSLILGAGGITALPVNAIAVGLIGSAAAVAAFRSLAFLDDTLRWFAAGWLSVTTSALLVALALGVQPMLAHAPDGAPRFFPFGVLVTLPAIVLPHLIVGVAEGLLTVAVCRLIPQRGEAP